MMHAAFGFFLQLIQARPCAPVLAAPKDSSAVDGRKRAKGQIEETVRSAVASLPEKLRVCVELRYVEDFSYYAALNESSSFQTKQ